MTETVNEKKSGALTLLDPDQRENGSNDEPAISHNDDEILCDDPFPAHTQSDDAESKETVLHFPCSAIHADSKSDGDSDTKEDADVVSPEYDEEQRNHARGLCDDLAPNSSDKFLFDQNNDTVPSNDVSPDQQAEEKHGELK